MIVINSVLQMSEWDAGRVNTGSRSHGWWWEGWQTQATWPSLGYLSAPASTLPQEHTVPSMKVVCFTPGCPYKSPQAALWFSLPFHNCFSQKPQCKRLTSLSVQTSLLIYWSTWLLESHVTQAFSKDLHVLASVVSDTHSHWRQGRLCLEDTRNLEGTLGMRSHPCPSPSNGTLLWPDAGILRAGMKEDRRGSIPGHWPCFTPGCPETLSSWMVWSCSLKGCVTTEPPQPQEALFTKRCAEILCWDPPNELRVKK